MPLPGPAAMLASASGQQGRWLHGCPVVHGAFLDDTPRLSGIVPETSCDLCRVLLARPTGFYRPRPAAEPQSRQHVDRAAQHGGKRHVVEAVPLLVAGEYRREERGLPDSRVARTSRD